jgi:hypothetical protein
MIYTKVPLSSIVYQSLSVKTFNAVAFNSSFVAWVDSRIAIPAFVLNIGF